MLTLFRSEFTGGVEHDAHLLVGDDLVGGGENKRPPTFHERVGFRAHFLHLSFQFLLGRQKTVPKIVSNQPLLQQVLKGGFIFPETNSPIDVRNGTPQEGGFQRDFGCRRILLQKGDVGISFWM